MTKVLIADDHAIVRRGLKEILTRALDTVVCGEAKDAQEILLQVQSRTWEILLLDVGLPGRSGIDVLPEIYQMDPQVRVLVLSTYPEDQYGKRVLKAGAWGYMSKESAPEELIRAIQMLLAGKRYVSAALAERLAKDLHERGEVPAYETLSGRELEILRMIASGKTVGHIAEELHLAVTTVSTYRARILEKTRNTTTGELIRYALQNRLVSD